MRFFSALIALFIIFQPVFSGDFAFAQQPSAEERAELERQLAELEKEIEKNEATIAEYQKQGKTLTKEINGLNAQINKHNLQIKAINLTLSKLDGDIAVTEGDIRKTEQKLDASKTALARLIRRLYENDRKGLVAIFLNSQKLSDFFGDVNNLLTAQDAIGDSVAEITDIKNQLVQKKDGLSEKRSDAAALKAAQDAQKAAADRVKRQKNQLLADTKGQEAKYQEIVKVTKKTAAEIRKRIFQFLGGGELSFEEAYEIAKLAEKAAGVRAALVLAILDRESGFGQNVGRCSYEKAMHPTRDLPIFLRILEALKSVGKAPPEPVLVSCPITRHGAYGGAMGPAQFIPSTWKIYENKIVSVTGSAPANPWNNADAIVGTSLYLADAYNSKSCRDYASANRNVLPERTLLERCAAAKYYAGGRWHTYRFFYGDPVVERANKFQQDIDTLNS